MNSRDYWANREAEALKHYIKDEAEYQKELHRIYQNMLDACQKEIDSFYGRYASAEGITIAEAKKRVSKLDIAAYERKAKKYVKEKDFSAKANEEMRLYNATMKINRLEMLKANIGLEVIAGHDELERFMGGILKGRTKAELKRQAGILGKTVRNNAQLAHAIVNGSFHNGTFSDRIWQYQDMMRVELGRLLQSGLIQGKGARAIAKDLKKYWYGNDPKTGGGAQYCMERLMRTELARVQTEAQKQSFIRNGFNQYTFIVNGGCCPICEGVAKKNDGHYDVEDMMPGTNAPPMHPNCRCSTAAYEDSQEYEDWLDYLAGGGTTAEWENSKKALEKPKKIDTIKMGKLSESSKLGETHGKALEKLLSEAPEKAKRIWNKFVDRLNVEEAHDRKGRAFCNYTKGITCDIEKVAKGNKFISGWKDGAPIWTEGKKPYYTAFHEFGHNISALMCSDATGNKYGSISTTYVSKKHGMTLNDMLKKEGNAYVDSIHSKLKADAKAKGLPARSVRKMEAWNIIKQEILSRPTVACSDISDMWDGISNGSCLAHYGHTNSDKKYWSKIAVGEEAFAEMFSATVMNPDSVEVIKHYFPQAYEIFEEIIESEGE